MQLKAAEIALASTLSVSGCEPAGGVSVLDPMPPDAIDGTTTGGGPSTLDGAGLDDGGGAGLDDAVDDGVGPTSGPASDGGEAGATRTLVSDGALWRVHDTAGPPWASAEFDDSSWSEVAAPLGSGYDVAGVWEPVGVSTYMRRAFELEDPQAIAYLELRIRRDDGAIAYLNGDEIARTNLPDGPIEAGTPAEDEVERADGFSYFFAAPDPGLLVAGTNVLAVEVHQRSVDDLAFDARLRALPHDAAVDALTVQFRTVSYGGEYSPRNVGVAWIETHDGEYVRTVAAWADERREHLVAWAASGGPTAVDTITSATAGSHASRLLEWTLDDVNGELVPPGDYVLRLEFTEANSNEGAGAGPTISIPFRLGEGARVIAPEPSSHFRDLLLLVPGESVP